LDLFSQVILFIVGDYMIGRIIICAIISIVFLSLVMDNNGINLVYTWENLSNQIEKILLVVKYGFDKL